MTISPSLSLSFTLCIECESMPGGIYDKERLVKPKQLVQLFDCMQKSTIKSMEAIETNCTSEEVHGLYDKIMDRLNGDRWCANAIGLNLTVSKQ